MRQFSERLIMKVGSQNFRVRVHDNSRKKSTNCLPRSGQQNCGALELAGTKIREGLVGLFNPRQLALEDENT